jgi:hypothetical protein
MWPLFIVRPTFVVDETFNLSVESRCDDFWMGIKGRVRIVCAALAGFAGLKKRARLP